MQDIFIAACSSIDTSFWISKELIGIYFLRLPKISWIYASSQVNSISLNFGTSLGSSCFTLDVTTICFITGMCNLRFICRWGFSKCVECPFYRLGLGWIFVRQNRKKKCVDWPGVGFRHSHVEIPVQASLWVAEQGSGGAIMGSWYVGYFSVNQWWHMFHDLYQM